jgi:mannose/cellobiose epimerase-like protein (N-acyl-D-glucosamine 2-epimerase family)
LDGNYRENPPAFWEKSDLSGKPLKANGMIIVDPGHATEFSGFLAEIVPFLPETWGHPRWNKKSALAAALNCHLYGDRVGFSKKGVMYKAIDLETEKPLPDMQALNAGGRLTAPWWNVREHSAAALKLYTLTRDARLIESYRKAQHASYTAYPNQRIMNQMIQTVDPETLEPLDIAPATGNMDAMHDPRSRIREMECLETLVRDANEL